MSAGEGGLCQCVLASLCDNHDIASGADSNSFSSLGGGGPGMGIMRMVSNVPIYAHKN